MLLTVWSPKGGSGTSVLAAALGLHLARAGGAALVDLGGDQPALLGLADDPGVGVLDWLARPAEVPAGALEHLMVEAAPDLGLLPRGSEPRDRPPPERVRELAAALRGRSAPAVLDAGSSGGSFRRLLVEESDASVVVARACYVTLRRATADELVSRADGLVVLEERTRALGARHVREVLDLPLLARVPARPEIARAADAGTLAARVPRALDRAAAAVVAALAVGERTDR